MTLAQPVVSVLVERGSPGNRQLLLQVRSKPSAGPFRGLLELPQGKLQLGDTVLSCARRELREETGLTHFVPQRPARDGMAHGERLDCFETFAVRERGHHDFLGICIIGSARGEPRASAESESPRWCSQREALAYLDAGIVFPLNAPMIAWYCRLASPVDPEVARS